ncbi:MAG: MFS transporter [Proteobacteria bacterium]|nr:MFS transporter [Pseudomonadota bacterium]
MTPAQRLAVVTLAATTAIQVFTSLAGTAVAVLAPAIAGDLGVAPKWVGVFVGLVYTGAMMASPLSGTMVRRFGAIRVSQACALICAIGIAIVAVAPHGWLWLPALAAIVLGWGYGPITPASSHVLARTTPPAQMSLMFSIKQTGVPAGVALGGAVLPALAVALTWQHAFVAIALAGIAVAFAAQPIRATLDDDADPATRLSMASVLAPMRTVLRTPALRRLALLSLAYAAVQVSVTSFLVVYLTETLRWSLVAAGFGLTLATVGGVVGRIGWGAVADRLQAPMPVLVVLGLLSATCALAMAAAQPQWPAGLVLGLATLLGATAIGWNGVQLAEVARRAPAGHAGAITGAASFITFSGVVSGPPLFAVLTALTGTYRAGFLLLAVLAVGGAAIAGKRSPAP